MCKVRREAARRWQSAEGSTARALRARRVRAEQGEALVHAQSAPGGRARGTMAAPWETLRAAMAAVLLLGWGAHGLYFHIGETEKRCFIEEIPDETMVIGAGGGGEHREWRGA